MKSLHLAAASSLALCALLSAASVSAETYPTPRGDRVDANGMPTTHSTPAEQAQTADINNQVAATNQAADAQANSANAQYQQQQQDYQSKQQAYESQKGQYQQQLDRNARQQERYENRCHVCGAA